MFLRDFTCRDFGDKLYIILLGDLDLEFDLTDFCCLGESKDYLL